MGEREAVGKLFKVPWGAGKHYGSVAYLPFKITVTELKHEYKPGLSFKSSPSPSGMYTSLRTQPQVTQKHTESAQKPIALIILWAISGLWVSAGEAAIMGVCVFAYWITCG